MAKKEERILKDWQNYINDYQQKLNSQSFDLSTANGRRDYAMMNAHLQSLRSKYAYLQQYYAEHGNLPDNITFEAMEGAAGAYRTEQDGEIKAITFMGGGNGGLTVSAPDFSGAYHWQGPESLIASGYEDTSSSPYKYGIEITGPAGAGYISMEVTGTLFSGMTSTYHFHYESIPSRWTVQLNINNTIPVYDQTSPLGMNAFTFNGGVAWSLDEMTVPTDEPWRYYETKVKPNVDPGDDIYPDGYEPPGPGNDPDDDPEEEIAPDKQDWGDKQKPNNGFDIPDAFVKYAAFNSSGINNLSDVLWDAPDNFWEALTMTNRNNANWLDYFVSLRAYPYKINPSGEPTNTLYVGAGGELNLGDQVLNRASKVPTVIRHSFTIKVPKYYNNFLDFAPYTKAEIYLPFSGTWEVNPKLLYHSDIYNMQEQAVDNYIYIQLKMDITDGSGVWQVLRSYNKPSGEAQYIILEKQCKIGVEVPLSGLNATTMSSNIVNATLGIGQAALSSMSSLGGAVAAGSVAGPVGAAVGTTMAIANSGVQMLNAATNYANANREIPSYTGGMSGLAAANCNVIPSITFVRPIVENPETFPHTVGNLVNKASKLEKLDGYTTCRNVDVSNVPQATDKEKAELKRILEGGFYAVSG